MGFGWTSLLLCFGSREREEEGGPLPLFGAGIVRHLSFLAAKQEEDRRT
jgi:hypothetical protein